MLMFFEFLTRREIEFLPLVDGVSSLPETKQTSWIHFPSKRNMELHREMNILFITSHAT